MVIEIESGLIIEYNMFDKKCGIVYSPKAKGKIFVPKYVEINNEKYIITYIDSFSFAGTKIEFLEFSEDSEIECFSDNCFTNSNIKKIKIPPSVKELKYHWCEDLQGLEEIEISPSNTHFQYINNQYLLGKSKENSDEFDTLLYARSDIEEAFIPPQIKIIKGMSFGYHKQLKSVKFPDNSELKTIEKSAFKYSTIQTLFLPASVEFLNCFQEIHYLTNIEISPKNELFSLLDNQFLVKKSQKEDQIYDLFVFASRDTENVKIPSQIKIICECAFEHCNKLKSITFEPNSSLKSIQERAFNSISGPENFVFPSLLEVIESRVFYLNNNLKSVVILSKDISIESFCFQGDKSLTSISFPNADRIKLDPRMLANVPFDIKLYIKHDAELVGGENRSILKHINYIEEEIS